MADYRLKKSSIIQNSYMWIKLTINITWTKTKKKIYIYRKHIITLKSGKCCLQQHVNTNDHQFAVCIKCCVNKTIPTIFLSVFTIAYFVTFVLPSKKKKTCWSEFTFMTQFKYSIKNKHGKWEKLRYNLHYRIWYK